LSKRKNYAILKARVLVDMFWIHLMQMKYVSTMPTSIVDLNLRPPSWLWWIKLLVSQTSFSSYLHNQWTNFHKLSCTGKPQMRAICTYVGGIKVTTNDWDIRPSVAVKASFANISWMAKQIHTIKLVLESTRQFVSNNIWCISKQ